jgi:putative ABC transport system substrate-binding protein
MVPVIGFLGVGSAQSDAFRVTGFGQGLKEAGFVEGQNLTIEYRGPRITTIGCQ